MFKWFRKNISLLVILGASIIVVTFFNNKEEYVAEYNNKINALNSKIDSLHSQNSKLEEESKILESKIAEYDKKIKLLNSRIYVIKKQTQQKVDSVDFFGDDELEQFFAERYKSEINSSRHNQDSIN